MATLTTGDIKTIDELAEIGKDELSNEDSLLTFDKDMNCHKKLKVTALRAFVNENAHNAAQQAEAAAQSASLAQTASADASSSAALAKSWATGGTGTRTDEDTDNARYYAEEAEAALHEIRLFDGGAVLLVGVTGESLSFLDRTGGFVSVDAANETLEV